ncbi:mRNA cleavage and polyadenylation specificity factor complex subunit Rna14 [Schizosaccharomyces japonicus yFS275]|uniref:mRNA 3'-end-processing protein RNA14 n=1 Tax=Schizosaccharomyces japonicus (strain yFS275 / FY16936) TaxID=402676 RepID=B6K4N2_SCHJY|nr:mRNA cleavage and polyadenylation specificity factor complex subunit Rna14 [Schizosaccharomyces japonicus yFS275]EEB08439.1 mRNA cleavage and polyadenylation specificity factor complex subunit Rna14 [Schizosaccharomyces japonicus yFS275]
MSEDTVGTVPNGESKEQVEPSVKGKGVSREDGALKEKSPSTKRKRLPNDKIGRLRDRIDEDPHDLGAWYELIGEYGSKGKHEELRDTFEQMLRPFPYVPKVWVDYINAELAFNDFQAVELLFSRCLLKVLSVDICSLYLGYIRRINPSNDAQARTTISQAYEFVIDTVGVDIDSGPIWADYIDFLRSAPANSTWEQQQKLDSIRRVYQRAIATPLLNVEKLWRDYDTFENSINRATARKFLAEKSPLYMNARTAMRELSHMLQGLRVYDHTFRRSFTPQESEAYRRWYHWAQWEMKDPLDLRAGKPLQTRVTYAFEQAMLYIPLSPRIWLDAFSYFIEINEEQRGLQALRRGMRYCPSSFLLRVRFAEHEEANKRMGEVRSTYESLIQALGQEIQKIPVPAENDPNRAKVPHELLRKRESLIHQHSMAWACHMNAARRIEGIKAARAVFTKARKAANQSYEVYIASAMMEHYCSKDSGIASKIFELGLKYFGNTPEYVLTYLDYLIFMNDDTNARALFEKAIAKLAPKDARLIYKRWLDYESKYGDLNAALQLSQRMSVVYPDETPRDIFLSRFGIADDDTINFVPSTPLHPGEAPQALGEVPVINVKRSTKSPEVAKEKPLLPEGTADESDNESTTSVSSSSSSEIAELEDTRLLPASQENASFYATKPPSIPTSKEPSFPPVILDLLAQLPPPHLFQGARFDSRKLIQLIANSTIPTMTPADIASKIKRARHI